MYYFVKFVAKKAVIGVFLLLAASNLYANRENLLTLIKNLPTILTNTVMSASRR